MYDFNGEFDLWSLEGGLSPREYCGTGAAADNMCADASTITLGNHHRIHGMVVERQRLNERNV